jgi:hypothetical protein
MLTKTSSTDLNLKKRKMLRRTKRNLLRKSRSLTVIALKLLTKMISERSERPCESSAVNSRMSKGKQPNRFGDRTKPMKTFSLHQAGPTT